MSVKKKIKSWIEKKTNSKIYRLLPLGNDSFYDIQRLFKGYQIQTIFDVGANVGQSASVYAKKLPHAKIYCFEPSKSTFIKLKENLSGYPHISVANMAIGEKSGKAKFLNEKGSDKSRVLGNEDENLNPASIEEIEMNTLSGFCIENSVNHVNYLKIDTEGYDLKVLKSAADMLKNRNIDFIETEVGMHPENELHVPFEKMKEFMEQFNYYTFGIYEQIQEWKLKKPILRRVNMVFVSPNL